MKKILCLALALCMLSAFAGAEGKVYHIGIVQLVQHNALDAASQGFMDTLKAKLGEENVVFDYQNAQGDSNTCSTIATGFVNNGYDLIMGNATPAVQACVNATSDIPVVGTSVTDYGTALGNPDLVPENGTGLNCTGASDGVSGQLYADMVMELIPDVKKVSVLYCSAEPNSIVQYEAFAAAMPEGVEVTAFTFADSNDIQSVTTAAIADCDIIYIPTDNTAASNMTLIANVTIPAGIPIVAGEENMMAVGAMATVSINYYNVGVMAGEQAYEILVNGADVSTMPIAYTTDPVKEYNPSYADAIGFTIPEGYTAYEPAN